MRKRTFTPPHFRTKWLKLFLLLFLATTVTFWGCDKAKEAVNPVKALQATQAQQAKKGSDADDKYKTDKTGQYVSKDVQVPDYGGKERPTRPKYDAAGDLTNYLYPLPDDPCDGCGGGGGGGGTSIVKDFISSETHGFGYIYNLQFIKDSNPLPEAEPGYTRIDVDLNKGAGGKYIYLEFTRSSENIKTSHPDYYDRNNPVTDIKAEGYTTGMTRYWYPPTDFKNIYEHTCQCVTPNDWFDYKVIDLNDGASGKYIYAYLSKNSSKGTPIKEVGILYGNSSSIQPPTGWVKVSQDLNEGAGGDYIYLCYKK